MPYRVLLASSLVVLLSTSLTAQTRPSPPPDSAPLASGWALLAKGDAAGASAVAWQELTRDAHSTGALVLAVDAELARSGSSGGLSGYERWLGSRRLENAHVLRRVAYTLLVEVGATQNAGRARLEALTALAADGDQAAAASLIQAAEANGVGEAQALASIGNERAVKVLVSQLQSMPGNKTALIEALADSGSKLAVPPLKALLADPNDVNRAAAAEGLGRLGATDVIPQLKALLSDQVFTVRLKAAGALVRLNDSSGMPLLMQLTGNEHAGVRLAAARELGSQPDPTWQNLVRSLTNDPDPTVRMEAARLIAPYDQPLASNVLASLMRDSNIGIREAASGVLVEHVASDFSTLRGLMRSSDPRTQVQASARILELTR